MDFVYVLICGAEWEDSIIFLSKEDAISASIKYPKIELKFLVKLTREDTSLLIVIIKMENLILLTTFNKFF